ncbi:MAG: 4-alpha-glucanotransferase [Weeksellaceae bacterium]
MKISFNIKYSTQVGENIFIKGNRKSLGLDDNNQAVLMHYKDRETWSIDVDLKHGKFSYQYLVQDQRTGDVNEEWSHRKVSMPKGRQEIIIEDEWLSPHLPQFNLNTDFFQHLAPKLSAKKLRVSKKDTHLFKVPFRIMNPNERLYIIGSPKALGGWDETKAIEMKWDGEGHFYISIDLSDCTESFAYKYIIKDNETGALKYYETGENRKAECSLEGQFRIYHEASFRQPKDKQWKGSGVAIPVFSLRTEQGLGVGEFVDLIDLGEWCKEAGISLIQILPIHDTIASHDWSDSYPYSAISVHALHPIYLRLTDLPYRLNKEENKIVEEAKTLFNQTTGVEYPKVIAFKLKFLHAYFQKHQEKILKKKSFVEYYKENTDWLQDYAAFCVLRDQYKTVDFTQWENYAVYNNETITAFFQENHANYQQVMFYAFLQWQLHEQLSATVAELHKIGITLKGDLPIGVYRHSVDVWSSPELFHVDEQAGAPPDDFAITGQNWQFPTYNWEVMQENDYAWWKSRFQLMSRYFDAFRIDHILGFFRIWQIPTESVQGILGRFEPSLPISMTELHEKGIYLPEERLYKPFINQQIVQSYFGEETDIIIDTYFDYIGEYDGTLQFKTAYNTQSKILKELGFEHPHLEKLFELVGNVLFIKEDTDTLKLHPRFAMYTTSSYHWLPNELKHNLYELYQDYFYHRHEEFWAIKGMEKLPALINATNMLACGEDLGMVPHVVPQVMHHLGILSLQIQRMPSDPIHRFFHPSHAPYLCVVSPSSHDTSTLRQWWKEDREKTQYFYNHIMGRYGEAPQELTTDMLESIIDQHSYSPAMLAVIPLQEFLGMDADLRNPDENVERINIPSIFPHKWQYRMHLNISELKQHTDFTQKLKEKHKDAHRG